MARPGAGGLLVTVAMAPPGGSVGRPHAHYAILRTAGVTGTPRGTDGLAAHVAHVAYVALEALVHRVQLGGGFAWLMVRANQQHGVRRQAGGCRKVRANLGVVPGEVERVEPAVRRRTPEPAQQARLTGAPQHHRPAHP